MAFDRKRKDFFGRKKLNKGSFPKHWLEHGVNPASLSPNAVDADKWDSEDLAKMKKDLAEFAASRGALKDFAPTGDDAFDDMFFQLLKADPKLLDAGEMKPSNLVNRRIAELARELDEFERLRGYTVGDDVQAALATVSVEPDLETLFDNTEAQHKQAQKLQQALQNLHQANQEKHDLDDIVRRWTEDQENMEQGECQTCEGTGQVPKPDDQEGDDGDGEGDGADEASSDGQGEAEDGDEPGGSEASDGSGHGDGGTEPCPDCAGSGAGTGGASQQMGGQPGGGSGQPGGGRPDELTDEQRQQLDDFAKQQRELGEKIEQARAEAEQQGKDFEKSMDQSRATMRNGLANAFNKAADEAQTAQDTALAWGLDPGTLQKMPAAERMEMARKLNSDRFKRIADLFGPMRNMMLSEQKRRTINTTDEIYDVEIGDDLGRLVPSELLRLAGVDSDEHDEVAYNKYLEETDDMTPMTHEEFTAEALDVAEAMELDFYRKLSEHGLLQYAMQGEEKLARGGIIICEDGSGSMHGERELWAKAVMLCLLHLARMQKRSFRLIHFGGPGTTKVIEFTEPGHFTMDRIMEAAELFFGGGTDFATPMRQAMGFLQEDFARTGEARADVVFVTDDECYVDAEFMTAYLDEMHRMSATTWGISVVAGGGRREGALQSMTEGKVATIKDLSSGDDIRHIFRGV